MGQYVNKLPVIDWPLLLLLCAEDVDASTTFSSLHNINSISKKDIQKTNIHRLILFLIIWKPK